MTLRLQLEVDDKACFPVDFQSQVFFRPLDFRPPRHGRTHREQPEKNTRGEEVLHGYRRASRPVSAL